MSSQTTPSYPPQSTIFKLPCLCCRCAAEVTVVGGVVSWVWCGRICGGRTWSRCEGSGCLARGAGFPRGSRTVMMRWDRFPRRGLERRRSFGVSSDCGVICVVFFDDFRGGVDGMKDKGSQGAILSITMRCVISILHKHQYFRPCIRCKLHG
jgi:hypothetical protein